MALRVAIVGGGIVGCAAARELAARGAEVTLFERTAIGAHASGRNPGGLNPLHGAGIPGPLLPLALAALRLHRGLARELGCAPDGRAWLEPVTRLLLARDAAEQAALEDTQRLYESVRGFSAQPLDSAELAARERGIAPGFTAGLLVRGNLRTRPLAYTCALMRRATELGAREVLAGVDGLVTRGGRVTGVRAAGDVLHVDAVVIATGPWAEEPARWLGATLPVEPVKGDLLRLELAAGLPEHDLAWREIAVYRSGDSVWLGTTEARVGLDEHPQPAAAAALRASAEELFPLLRGARELSHVAGLRPVTPDGMPVLGRAPAWENVCLALGAGRKGVLMASAMAQAVADLLLAGETTLPIAPCAAERFAGVSA